MRPGTLGLRPTPPLGPLCHNLAQTAAPAGAGQNHQGLLLVQGAGSALPRSWRRPPCLQVRAKGASLQVTKACRCCSAIVWLHVPCLRLQEEKRMAFLARLWQSNAGCFNVK